MGYIKDKYDVNLTQSIWEDCITPDSDTYYTYSLTPICITGFTDTSSSCEEEESYINYHNFQSITGVDFTVRDGEGTPEVFSCMKGVSMTDVQFIGHTVSVLGDGVSLSGLTFTRGGCIQMTEEDTMAKGVHALQDFGTVEITKVAGGTAAVVGVTVGRNMNLLSVQSGGVVSGVIVSGNLTSACVDSGAVVSGVTAGLLGAVSNDPNQFGEATVMNVVSSGTAKEISLGYGGTVNVKAGATIKDCTASGYGGALGAYNFACLV